MGAGEHADAIQVWTSGTRKASTGISRRSDVRVRGVGGRLPLGVSVVKLPLGGRWVRARVSVVL